ncbi:unnamed protein product [Pleuronectes platessa]|uniref:Uncharacterized protein n=1 Tax=Pleuronectes platessa TaxID=8262 RepID=A0A9N7U1R1_PLEPL|nr:unnamed protein product [Pleuronectes platessa]
MARFMYKTSEEQSGPASVKRPGWTSWIYGARQHLDLLMFTAPLPLSSREDEDDEEPECGAASVDPRTLRSLKLSFGICLIEKVWFFTSDARQHDQELLYERGQPRGRLEESCLQKLSMAPANAHFVTQTGRER